MISWILLQKETMKGIEILIKIVIIHKVTKQITNIRVISINLDE